MGIINWYKNIALKNSNKRWRLYNGVPDLEVVYTFAFIDQLGTSGHFNCQLTKENGKLTHKAIINLNLYNRIDEEVIFHVINHENLHIAIINCLRDCSDDFIETVIEHWLLESEIIQDGNYGKVSMRKAHKSTMMRKNGK